MKRILALALALVLVFSLAACGGGTSGGSSTSPDTSTASVSPSPSAPDASGTSTSPSPDTSSAPPASGDFTLAWVSGNDIYPFHVRLRTSIEKAGAAAGLKVLVADAKSDVNNEVNFMESFITQGVQTIATAPRDPVGTVAGVEKVRAEGIPYLAVCGQIEYEDYIYVGSNDVDAGTLQAEYLAEILPQNAKFLYLIMNPVESGTIQRKEGLQKLFELRPDVSVLDEQAAYGTADEGMTVTETWLQTFSDFDAIVGQNDDMVLGAYQALAAAGKEKDVITVGVDGGLEALDSIKAGELTATALQNAEGIGQAVVDVAVKIKNGADASTIDDVFVPFVMITKDNVDQYIAVQRG